VHEADRPGADDHYVVAELDATVQAAIDATGHGFTETGFLVGKLAGDLEQASCWGYTVLSKAPSHSSPLKVLAKVVDAPDAVGTFSAHHSPTGHDPISDSEPLDAVPGGHKFPRPLVTGCIGEGMVRRTYASVCSQVAGADATSLDADQYLIIGGDNRPGRFFDSQVSYTV